MAMKETALHVFVENLGGDSVYLTDFLLPLFTALISGCLVAIFSVYIVNRHLNQLLSFQKLKEAGFESISFRWQDEKEVKKMCKRAKKIKVINVSGTNYYKKYEQHFKEAMSRGVEIYALVADPDSFLLTDIEEMEKMTYYSNGQRIRQPDTYIKPEIEELINRYKDTDLHIRFYRSEYRLPFILAYYEDGSLHTWLQVTLPPARSEKAVVLRGKREANYISEPELNFIDMMEVSFDTIWEHSEKSEVKVKRMREACKDTNSKKSIDLMRN